jgi:hypothetical protein
MSDKTMTLEYANSPTKVLALKRAAKEIRESLQRVRDANSQNATTQKSHQDDVNTEALKFVLKLEKMDNQKAQILLRDILSYADTLGVMKQLNMLDELEHGDDDDNSETEDDDEDDDDHEAA